MASTKNEPEFNIKHRLIGAAVLLAAAVIFIPMILKGNGVGSGKSSNLTKEVQEWIVETEDSETYTSRVKPLEIGQIESNDSSVNDQLNDASKPALKVIEPATTESGEIPAEPQITEQQPQAPAAKEVAAIEPVVEKSEVKAEPKAESPKAAAPKKESSNGIKAENVSRGWVVRVGTFSKPENAQNLISKLNSTGFDSRYEVIPTDAGQATRVWVGPYEKRVTAARALELVESNTGVKGFIKSFP